MPGGVNARTRETDLIEEPFLKLLEVLRGHLGIRRRDAEQPKHGSAGTREEIRRRLRRGTIERRNAPQGLPEIEITRPADANLQILQHLRFAGLVFAGDNDAMGFGHETLLSPRPAANLVE